MTAGQLVLHDRRAAAAAADRPRRSGPGRRRSSGKPVHARSSREILRTEGLNEFSHGRPVAAHARPRSPARTSSCSVDAADRRAGEHAHHLGQRPAATSSPCAPTSTRRAARASPRPRQRWPTGTWRSTPRVPAAAGITDQTMQFHGTADRYTLNGAHQRRQRSTRARPPRRRTPRCRCEIVGTSGGQAAAFTYDLAQSVVYTRQGNPAWAGQNADGLAPDPVATTCSSAGQHDRLGQPDQGRDPAGRRAAAAAGQPDRDDGPAPQAAAAVLVLPAQRQGRRRATGDDHGERRHGRPVRPVPGQQPRGCSVANWKCLRFTSYVFPSDAADRRAGRRSTTARASRWAAPEPDCAGLHARIAGADVLHHALAVHAEVPDPAEPGEQPDALPRLERLARRADTSSSRTASAGHELLLLARRVDQEPARLHDRLRHPDALRRHQRHA